MKLREIIEFDTPASQDRDETIPSAYWTTLCQLVGHPALDEVGDALVAPEDLGLLWLADVAAPKLHFALRNSVYFKHTEKPHGFL